MSDDSSDAPSSHAWWAILAGAGTGVFLRLAFLGGEGERWTPMAGSFVFLVPIAVAAITIYFAERKARRSWGFYAGAGALANMFFVIGTLLIMIEGLICAIVIVPLFAFVGAIAGLVVGVGFRIANWPRQATFGVVLLPLMAGALEPTGLPIRTRTLERSVLIEAPREIVWHQLFELRAIEPDEVDHSVAARIGVPRAQSAVAERPGIRRIRMSKNVYFDQIEIERREYELVRWRHQFYADSFPPKSFDQHVVMGGAYFDVEEAAYTLEDHGARTKLTLSLRYRVSTRFNWYADRVARIVLGNLEEVLLDVYRTRAVASGLASTNLQAARSIDGLEPRI